MITWQRTTPILAAGAEIIAPPVRQHEPTVDIGLLCRLQETAYLMHNYIVEKLKQIRTIMVCCFRFLVSGDWLKSGEIEFLPTTNT